MPKVLKIRSLYIFGISPEKYGGLKLIVCFYCITYTFRVNLQSPVAPESQGMSCSKQVQYLKFKCHLMKLMKLSTVSLDDELSFDEADFFSADKHVSFLQSDSTTLGVCGQAKCPNNTVQYLCNISKEKVKDKVDYLPADKHQRFLESDCITLGVCSQTSPNYSK